jgi:hypothetical protein
MTKLSMEHEVVFVGARLLHWSYGLRLRLSSPSDYGGLMSTSRPQYKVKLSHDELHEYVDAFKTSSDRSRNALYVVIVATVLIAIADYNTQPWSFAQHRIKTWYRFIHAAQGPGGARPQAVPHDLFEGDQDRLKVAGEEYLKQYTDRATLATSPIPGVWIDANDIGIIGGVTLILLMAVLVFCVMREHENLHLALYKVRRLHDSEAESGESDHGDSKANFLYHALAMRQVLSSPPTLARWNRNAIFTLPFFLLVFLMPTIGYGFVVRTNWATAPVGSLYNVNIWALNAVQFLLLGVLLVLSMTALLHARAMSKRWERAFRRINPRRVLVQQPLLRDWLVLYRKRSLGRYWRNRVANYLAETIKKGDTLIHQPHQPTAVPSTTLKVKARVSQRELRRMAQELIDKIISPPGGGTCHELSSLCELKVKHNEISGEIWTVDGEWTVRPTLRQESMTIDSPKRN